MNPQNNTSMPALQLPGFVISGTAFDPSSGGVQSGIDHVNLYIQLPGGWWNGSATVGQRTAVTAQGTTNWSYAMTSGVPPGGPFNIASEAVDKAGNVQTTPYSVSTTLTNPQAPFEFLTVAINSYQNNIPFVDGVSPSQETMNNCVVPGSNPPQYFSITEPVTAVAMTGIGAGNALVDPSPLRGEGRDEGPMSI